MMNVKETLKRLHKKLPAMGLDELFELLDCYVEQSCLTWEPNQLWYSNKIDCGKTTGINESINKVDICSAKIDPTILNYGDITTFTGFSSDQLTTSH